MSKKIGAGTYNVRRTYEIIWKIIFPGTIDAFQSENENRLFG